MLFRSSLDLGGGIGIAYRDERAPAIEDYVRLVQETVGNLGCEILLEPGRWMVGHAGILVTRVLYLKPGVERNFVIVDAAMNDLIRPTLYDAYHPILPVLEPGSEAAASRYDVVGPICESGDFFAHDRPLPPLASGDLLAITSAGAYGAVMASSYNSRPLVPEVMVRGGGIRQSKPAEPEPEQREEGDGEGGQDSAVQIAVEVRQQVAEGKGNKETGQSEGGPDGLPDALPADGESREPQPVQQAQPVPAAGIRGLQGRGLGVFLGSRPCLCQAHLISSPASDPVQSYHGSSDAL